MEREGGQDNLNVKGVGLLNNRENGWGVLSPSPMHFSTKWFLSLKDIRVFVKYRFR